MDPLPRRAALAPQERLHRAVRPEVEVEAVEVVVGVNPPVQRPLAG